MTQTLPQPVVAGGASRTESGRPRTSAGAGPFVINLCSSTTPMALSQPKLEELKRFSFFVSRRREEGRERFRLHMGYFDTFEEADEWLAAVRDIYPGAWVGEAPGKRLREREAAAAAVTQQSAPAANAASKPVAAKSAPIAAKVSAPAPVVPQVPAPQPEVRVVVQPQASRAAAQTSVPASAPAAVRQGGANAQAAPRETQPTQQPVAPSTTQQAARANQYAMSVSFSDLGQQQMLMPQFGSLLTPATDPNAPAQRPAPRAEAAPAIASPSSVASPNMPASYVQPAPAWQASAPNFSAPAQQNVPLAQPVVEAPAVSAQQPAPVAQYAAPPQAAPAWQTPVPPMQYPTAAPVAAPTPPVLGAASAPQGQDAQHYASQPAPAWQANVPQLNAAGAPELPVTPVQPSQQYVPFVQSAPVPPQVPAAAYVPYVQPAAAPAPQPVATQPAATQQPFTVPPQPSQAFAAQQAPASGPAAGSPYVPAVQSGAVPTAAPVAEYTFTAPPPVSVPEVQAAPNPVAVPPAAAPQASAAPPIVVPTLQAASAPPPAAAAPPKAAPVTAAAPSVAKTPVPPRVIPRPAQAPVPPKPAAARPAAPVATKPAPVAKPAPAKPKAPPMAAQLSNVREVLQALDETAGQTRQMPAPPVARSAPPAPAPVAASEPGLSDTQTLRILENRRSDGSDAGDNGADTGISMLRPDDTGTVRALKEAVQTNAPVSFAVQLQWSVQPIDLNKVPPLAIFSAYTLYTVEGSRDGRRWFGLRLGFFTDAISAKQVAYYVRSEFSAVAVVPVSPQERARASDAEKAGARVPDKQSKPKKPAPSDEFKLIDDTTETRKPVAPPPAAPKPAPAPAAARAPTRAAATPPAKKNDKTAKTPGKAKAKEKRGPQSLEETLEILGADQLELDNGRELLNDTGVRHLRVSVQKNSAFSRLLDRLSERVNRS